MFDGRSVDVCAVAHESPQVDSILRTNTCSYLPDLFCTRDGLILIVSA